MPAAIRRRAFLLIASLLWISILGSTVQANELAPSPGLEESSSNAALDNRLHEYEIRLGAHQRELLQRESELESLRHQLEVLQHKATRQPTSTASSVLPSEGAAPTAARPISSSHPTALPSPAAPLGGDPPPMVELQHALDVERENRATLEVEIQRLVSAVHSRDGVREQRDAFESARAEILVLRDILVEERRARERMEVTLEKIRSIAGVPPGPDWIDRFATSLRERREQATRLEEELSRANESVTALKGMVEAAGGISPRGDGEVVDTLRTENDKLRVALDGAQQANNDLRTQAELAARLADLLYAQPR